MRKALHGGRHTGASWRWSWSVFAHSCASNEKTPWASCIPRGPGAARRARGRRQLELLLDVDAVERVAAERRQLEVDHFLAHGLKLHRVRDREPGRLLLEDHLRLLVERLARLLARGRLRLLDEILE